ncbi:MAG: D-alanyl-D-alanine carboxypeptidase family protein [Dehalococcoidia bacterium]|nr:MAG: D-alanyl-D-alanine carboxypeptidase family protein [Dehalococcoidia bacterium]
MKTCQVAPGGLVHSMGTRTAARAREGAADGRRRAEMQIHGRLYGRLYGRLFGRRRFLGGGGRLAAGMAVGVVGAALIGCGSDEPKAGATSTPAATTTAGASATAPASVTASPTPAVVRASVDLLVIVDKQRALPDGYVPPGLQPIPAAWHAEGESGQQLRGDVIEALRPMIAAAAADGVSLRVESAYRSYSEQARTFAYWVSVMGEAQARRESAVPGHSEHQLGATVDFSDASNGWQLLESFAVSPSGKWLAANAYRFGFAMSYPPGGEAITGYIYEPWHFRYIGVAAAQEWQASGKTLVEYLEAVKKR